MTDDRIAVDEAEPNLSGLDLVVCPECGGPAEVVDRFALPSTDGPTEHAKVLCLARHWFLLPVSALPRMNVLRAPTGTGPVR